MRRRGSADDSVPKEKLARELGYGGTMAALDLELARAGLSRPEKRNISASKRAAVAGVIADRFLLVCHRGDCRAELGGDDRTVAKAATPAFCEMCGGSPVALALRDMTAACIEGGVRRIVIVGGSPTLRTRLGREVGPTPVLRLVDGTMARTTSQALSDMEWADLVVIWAGSELLHKATTPYPKGSAHLITVSRRGIPALARAVTRFAQAGEGGHGVP